MNCSLRCICLCMAISVSACSAPQSISRSAQPINSIIRIRGIDFRRVIAEDELTKVLGFGARQESQFGHVRSYILRGSVRLRCYFESDDRVYRPITRMEITNIDGSAETAAAISANGVDVIPIFKIRTQAEFVTCMGRQPDSLDPRSGVITYLPTDPYNTLYPRCRAFFGRTGCYKIQIDFPEG